MATLKTDISTAIDTAHVTKRVSGVLASGSVRLLEATYTFTGTEATSGDVIEIGEVPTGATVLPELSRVVNEAALGGSDLALPKIGDALDDDRYSATSVSLHSTNAANQALTANVAEGLINRHVVTEATKRLRATFSRTNAPTAGKKVKFLIAFRLGA